MKFFIVALVQAALALPLFGQSSAAGSQVVLQSLVDEVLANNPEIRAAQYQMEMTDARALQAGTLDDPELRYMREEMPGFHWNQAMYSRVELMQTIRFPTKLSKQREIAEIQADHAHHEHLEKTFEVLTKLKVGFYELWFVQQSILLNQENARLLGQFAVLARTKYGVGEATQQDVLKAQVELAKIDNRLVDLRMKELSAKAMLNALLNRRSDDTLGVASLADEVLFTPSLNGLQLLALEYRSMLTHDSLVVEENRGLLSLARGEYLPDLKFGLQYVTVPVGDFRGWSISAGITLPFAPWTLGKANARVEEATASVKRSVALYDASRNMVASEIAGHYQRVESAKRQLEAYRTIILPQAQQSLRASLVAYQTGRTDFLMLIDAYRTLVDLSLERLMLRMQFEQEIAELERSVGYLDIARVKG